MSDRDKEEQAIFRGKINKLIEIKNLRQTDICKALDIPNSTLNDWTSGVRPISHWRRILLAEFFGLSSSDSLFTNEGDFTADEIRELKEEINRLEVRNYYLENQMLLPCVDITSEK